MKRFINKLLAAPVMFVGYMAPDNLAPSDHGSGGGLTLLLIVLVAFGLCRGLNWWNDAK